jgi:limonene-1,2-epoxide hydrolase
MTKKTNATTAKKATAPKPSKTSTTKKTAGTTKKAAVATKTRKTSTTKTPTATTVKTTTNRKVTMAMKTRTQTSVENGIKILEMAIKGNLSLSEASRRNSFGRNYLSDVKAKIKENYKSKRINRETYRDFSDLLKTYNRL